MKLPQCGYYDGDAPRRMGDPQCQRRAQIGCAHCLVSWIVWRYVTEPVARLRWLGWRGGLR